MDTQKIAVIGLGRVGSAFLEKMLTFKDKGIQIAYTVECNETPGKLLAKKAGIKISTMDELIALGSEVDIIFDLTGIAEVRKELREKLAAANNRHTIIAPEAIARMLWTAMGGKPLPDVHGNGKKGY